MSTKKTISGIPVTAEWKQSGGVWRAEGTAKIAGLTLKGASLELDGNQFTGTVDKMSLDLFQGCSVTAGQTAFGLADGAAILRDVADAPVQRNETYLYFDAQEGMTLACAGFSLPLADGSSNRLYLNPDDPSVYLQASNVLESKTAGSLASSVRKVAGVDVGEVTVGASANGRIPWRATVANADGEHETVNANLVLGGDVEVKASQVRIAVREGSQAYSFRNQRLSKACTSGELVIPGFFMPMVGQVDLPLGKGVACVDGSVIRVSANLGGNAWDSLRLPELVTEALHQLRQAEYDLGGTINVSTGDLELAIAGSYPFGPWDLDGRLIISNRGIRVEGETDFDLGPLNFGGMEASVQIMGNSFMATASSEADLGVDGAKLKADFVMSPVGMGGSARAKIWGWNVKGDLKFSGYRFTGANLKTGFDIGPIGGKLKLKIGPSKVSVKVEGSFLGKDFDVKVNSNGRFKVAGKSFKL